jgi:hypothetical protein
MSIGFGDGKVRKGRGKKKSEAVGLSVRERKYLKERLKGHNKKLSALLAGYPESMANAAIAKIETPKVREEFQKLLNRVIPSEKLVIRLAEGLDATQTKFATMDGKITDFVEAVDFDQRRKYLELAASMSGRYERNEAKQPTVMIPIQIVTSIPRPQRG